MMNEKKKYIDIDSVVGNLDEVTVKDLRKQAGMSRKDFCNSFEIAPYSPGNLEREKCQIFQNDYWHMS